MIHWKPKEADTATADSGSFLSTTLQDFYKFLKDDWALLRAADARWLLVPAETRSLYHSEAVNGSAAHSDHQDDEPVGTTHFDKGTHVHGLRIALPEESIEIGEELVIGRGVDAHLTLDSPSVRTGKGRRTTSE